MERYPAGEENMIQVYENVEELIADFRLYGDISDEGVEIADPDGFRNNAIDRLVYSAVFGGQGVLTASRWLIWESAQALGCRPSSIHEYYIAGGQGSWQNQTTPAINVRGMTYDVARTILKASHKLNAGQLLFEIARSEIGYTLQQPHEYSAAVLGAAIREEHQGPVFIQGDHFQVNAANFLENGDREIEAVKGLTLTAMNAGFFNIDIDASTIVDYSLEGELAQQEGNARWTADLTAYIRRRSPEGVTVSVGGEIGEVGSQNSTVSELTAFMEQFNRFLRNRGAGLSKISVQTGTSHGGVPLPDGTVADVKVDFDTLGDLSRAAREDFGLAGAVQHGASTLPEEAFNRFSEANACEVHLATGFQNIIYESDAFPAELKSDVYSWLAANRSMERKDGETDAQFIYKTRKRGFGPFKQQIWGMDSSNKTAILDELQERFELIFERLNVQGSTELVNELTTMPEIHKPMSNSLQKALAATK